MRRCSASLAGLLIVSGCFSDPPTDTPSGDDTSAGASSSTASTTGMDASTSDIEISTTTGWASTGPWFETTGSTGIATSTGIEPQDTGDTMPTECPPDRPFIYLNFDGVNLLDGSGTDDAPNNRVANPQLIGAYGPYTGNDRPMLVQRVRAHFEAVGACVTADPPPTDVYDMIVVTSDAFEGALETRGLPNIDCENVEPNNVNVAFLSELIPLDTPQKATQISKLAAGHFGLEDVVGNDDIMNAQLEDTLPGATFTDQCLPLANQQVCVQDPTCPGMQQNSLNRFAVL